jgi:hypothetical protein
MASRTSGRNASFFFRVAAVLLIVFALGHTIGFLTFKAPTPEGRAVWAAMNSVRFHPGRATSSYASVYVGFGLVVTAYLAFSALVAWHLSSLARTHRQAIGMFGWAFFAAQLATLGLSWLYFSAPPVVFSAITAACVGAGAWLAQSEVAAGSEKRRAAA